MVFSEGASHLLEFTSVTCKNAAKMFPPPKDSPFKKNLLDDKVNLLNYCRKFEVEFGVDSQHNAGVILAEQKEAPVEVARQLSKVIDKEDGKPCNVLINHCPFRFTIPSEQTTIANIQLSFDALSTSAFLMTKSMYARNANSTPSTVLNVTTNFSQCSIPFSTVSSMALADVEAMTCSLNNGFAKGGLRVNAIAPNSALANASC
ncbi:unnamed protein product, partial [Mesorhabditis belari]|uniref:Uncharacterized protein n=1 Tax=Mesorhabditis belari TaxID=2138241 RepID=A0AAF3EKI1_9BILA